MNLLSRGRPFLLALLFLALALPATAGPPTDYVRGILEEVIRIQNDPAMEKTRAEAIRRIIQKNFDFPRMAQDSLGPAYARLSPGQRQEFERLFAALFQDSYTRLVLNFLKRETVTYHRETLEGPRAKVYTTLVRTNETIPVDYLMHTRSNSYLLFDVIVDGVSILENYKRQFAQVISTKSFDFLLERMRTQYKAIR
jgi:phospholipid transport system substrate-binding protein